MKKSNASEQKKQGFFSKIGSFFVNVWQKTTKIAKDKLDDQDVFRRMGSSAIWVFAFFVVAWLISFFFLPEKVLSKTWLVDKFFGIHALDKWAYWPKVLFIAGKIFLHYFSIMVVGVFVLNHFKVGRINLGYVFLFSYAMLIGAVVGSSSFDYYAKSRIFALVTFIRFSLWQLASFLLAATASTGLATFATAGWLEGSWRKVGSLGKPKIKGEDVEVLIYALLILIASSIAEARLIVFYKMHL